MLALISRSGVSSRAVALPLALVAFDLLTHDWRDRESKPYRDRRRILEVLGLDGLQWRTPEAFEDGLVLSRACNFPTPRDTARGWTAGAIGAAVLAQKVKQTITGGDKPKE